MINVNEVKQYAEFLAKKWQSGGSFSPAEYNQAIAFVTRDIVRKYIGLPEQYQPGNPQPQISYELTQFVREYISELKPTKKLPVTNGIFTRPDDYLYFSALRYRYTTTSKNDRVQAIADAAADCDCEDDSPTVNGDMPPENVTINVTTPITLLPDAQFDWAAQSEIRKPTAQHPIARMEDQKRFQVLPTSITEVELSYVRYPEKPVWAYTTSGGFNVYDAANSVQIELPEICATEFVVSLLNYLGISIREPILINWAERKKQTGS